LEPIQATQRSAQTEEEDEMIPPKHLPLRWFADEALFTYDAGGSVYTFSVPFGGQPTWTVVASSATSMTVENRQEIDITGLTQTIDSTLDPLSFMVGRWAPPIANTTIPGGGVNAGIVEMTWITSSKPIPAYSASTIPYTLGTGPTYDELIGYHNQSWSKDVTVPGIMKLNDVQTIGAMTPTTGRKLYCLARLIVTSTSPQNGDAFLIYPSVVTVAQQVVKEPTLEYIMRMARTMDS
jgi:hypothetical protein